ncbi:hypothetical protein I553_7277 [Mycobacterium xenopi 4042]|uniref:Uncharacterized protein n=1 Tax=Mycobacterium xenopi 4042 TaxID=1299334 RepID=X8E770_MYCXE|nr:hypothetical protein I553_7277 [Mycobacterium xenopi 4042]
MNVDRSGVHSQRVQRQYAAAFDSRPADRARSSPRGSAYRRPA